MAIDISNKEEKQIALTGAEIESALLQAHLSKDAIAKIEGLQSSASELDGYINKDRQTIVLLGDSITAGSTLFSTYRRTVTVGQFIWGNALSGHKFDLIYNAGIGGQTSSQILSRVQTDVIDKNPSHCMFLCGMNDGVTDAETLLLKNNIVAIYDALNSAGIYSFILTNTTSTTTATKNAQALEINAFIQEYFSDKPNMEVIDLNYAWIDPLSSTGMLKANVPRDTIHPSNLGGYLGGIEIAKHLNNPKFKLKYRLPVSNFDDNTINSKSKQLIKNPLCTGTGGGVAGGATGVCAFKYLLIKFNTATAVGSKEVRTDGLGEYQVIDMTTAVEGDYIRFETNNVESVYIPKIGDKYYLQTELIISNATALNRVQMQLYASNTIRSCVFDTYFEGTKRDINISAPVTLTLKTEEYTSLVNETNIFGRTEFYFNGNGRATVKIGRTAIIKVN